MVEKGKIHSKEPYSPCYIDKGIPIAGRDFVTQKAGKLRDYYRIGKMLGSGKFGPIHLSRCFRRSQNVRTQRNRSPKSS